MSANWDAVKQRASAIREQYRIQDPPVNMFTIANAEGIKILFFKSNEKTQNVSGLFDKNAKQIYLNAGESAARQNFTLAHELAHYFLSHKSNEYGVYRRDSLYTEQKPIKEQEADYFAAELLMPKDMIDKMKKTYSLTDRDAVSLSRLFGVSPSAMRYRLKELHHEQKT